MTKQNKLQKAIALPETKTKKAKRFSIDQAIDTLAKFGAYVVLFITSAYGMRSMLRSIQEEASLAITVAAVLALTYIIFRNRK